MLKSLRELIRYLDRPDHPTEKDFDKKMEVTGYLIANTIPLMR